MDPKSGIQVSAGLVCLRPLSWACRQPPSHQVLTRSSSHIPGVSACPHFLFLQLVLMKIYFTLKLMALLFLVGWIMPFPQDSPILVARTCKYVTLWGPRDFEGVIKLRVLRGGGGVGFCGWAPCHAGPSAYLWTVSFCAWDINYLI